MVKVAAKKQKVVRKPDNANKKKIVKIKKKKSVAEKPVVSDSSSDSDGEDQIQKLIEPYTKEQLIEFIIDAAVENPNLYNRIRDAADSDVSHRKIFVYGLGWDTTKETLTLAFKPYGEIEDCNVIIDRVTGKAKGFGFVQFRSRKAAMKALKEPKKKINNRMASCQLACLGSAMAGSTENSSRKIYVSNVQPDTDPEGLRTFFSKFGEIETGPLGFDSFTGKSRGFALFVYRTQQGFKKALEEPYKVFEGHQLHCQKAAEGKNKGTTTPVVQQPMPQMLSAMAAPQNFGLLGQPHVGLNPMYGGLGLLAANPLYAQGVLGQVGSPSGLGSYYAGAPHGLGIGGTSGSLLGLPNAHTDKKVGSSLASASGSRSQGAGGSFSGYSSHFCQELAIDLIPESLSESFGQFGLNYDMQDMVKPVPEFLSMFFNAEKNMPKAKGKSSAVLVVNKGNKKKLKGKGKRKVRPSQPKPVAVKKVKVSVPKDENCHYCGDSGHWQRNCPKYLEETRKMKAARASTSGKVPIPKDESCHYCGDLGHWQRNCSKYLEETRKMKATRVSTLDTKKD